MIRWITDRLGTAPAHSPEIGDDLARVDVRDLVDKFGNSPDAVRLKIDQGLALLGEGRRVIVCCDYGISRSNSVAAAILSRFEDIPLEDALQRVVEATGEKEIKLEPLAAVRAALGGKAGERMAGRGPRIMLTGGTGFIGRHLQAALADRAEIVLAAGGELDLTAGALALDSIVQKHAIDRIVHLANPRIYTSNRAVGDTLSILRNVLDVCRSAGTRLVYLSGWEVYSGYSSDRLIANEFLPMWPKGPYGEAKMLCERLIDHHRRFYGLDCTIVRSSPVYGRGADKPKFIYNFARKARDGLPIRTHRYLNGPPMLDLLHIDDLIRLLASVVLDSPAGEFNVGGGRLYSTAEIASLIVGHFGSGSAIEYQEIDDGVANILMDSRRARQCLDWRPQESFEASLPALMADLGAI